MLFAIPFARQSHLASKHKLLGASKEGLCGELQMSSPLIMKRLRSDINTQGNLSGGTAGSASGFNALWVMFSSRGVKGIIFHTVEVMMNMDMNCECFNG